MVKQPTVEASPLLPCPFCGLHPTGEQMGTLKKSNFSSMFELRHWCKDKARQVVIALRTAEAVAEVWNTRTDSTLIRELREALKAAQRAVKSLPDDALGRDAQEGYFYRDELLSKIEAALAKEGE